MTYDHLTYARDDKTVEITIDRPDKLNAFTVKTWEEFREALFRADEEDVRVIILSGAGDAFSVGDDIHDLEFEDAAEAWEYSKYIIDCAFTIEKITTPVIAKVDGYAFGGGCGLATLSDVTIATEASEFSLSEPRAGALDGLGVVRHEELIGIKPGRELMITAREFTAREAWNVNIVTEVVPAEDLDTTVEQRAEQIIRNAPMAIRLTKFLANDQLSSGAEGIAANAFLFMTEDLIEAKESFLDETEPEWHGR